MMHQNNSGGNIEDLTSDRVVEPSERDASRTAGLPTVIRREEGGAAVEVFPSDRTFPSPMPAVGAGGPPTGVSETPDLISLLKALRRRWCLALFGGLFFAALASAAVFHVLSSAKYTASVLIYVAENRPREIFETRESGVAYRTYQETQAILVKSRKVLETAIKVPAISSLSTVVEQDDPIEWLNNQIKVDFPRGSEILTISMSSNCLPAHLSMLVNAVADAYLKEIVDKERLERIARFDRLKALFADYQQDLIEKRREFKEMAGSIGTSDKQTSIVKQQMMTEHLGLARQELLRLQGDIRRSQARMNVLATRAEVEPSSNLNGLGGEAVRPEDVDPDLVEMQSRLADLKKKEANYRGVAKKGISDPSIYYTKKEIQQLAREIEARRKSLLANVSRGPIANAPAPSDGRVREVEEYLEILREQEKSLESEIKKLETQMSSLNIKTMDVQWLENEIAVATDTAKVVGSEVQSMTVEMQAPDRIKLIERASTPKLIDPLRRYKYTAMAGLGVFGAFLGLVSFMEFRSRKVDAPDEVADQVGLRVIGDLPKLAGPRRESRKSEEHDRLVQSIDAVRTMLLNAGRAQSFQVVMIASPLKGEGKTSLSCHLATSLARAGRRTLLIDGDLRKPSLHEIFDTAPEPGLCEVLRGEAGWETAVVPTPTPGLSLMLAGRLDAAAIEFLPREQFAGLLQELREQFDFVIVDTSPILQVTDPLIISQHVDAVLFSVLREFSQLPLIQMAYARLSSMGVRVLGAVVAGVPAKGNRYYGSYTTSQSK